MCGSCVERAAVIEEQSRLQRCILHDTLVPDLNQCHPDKNPEYFAYAREDGGVDAHCGCRSVEDGEDDGERPFACAYLHGKKKEEISH